VRTFVDRFVEAFRVGSRIPGRTGHYNSTTETALQGSKAVPLAWVKAPTQPTGAAKGLTHVFVAMPSRHGQSIGLFEVVNTGS
jgi:hypothetical protein